MEQIPFKEFKCVTHGWGWTPDCLLCKAQHALYAKYYGLIDEKPLMRINTHFFTPCYICGMTYSHDQNHTGTKDIILAWRKQLINRGKSIE